MNNFYELLYSVYILLLLKINPIVFILIKDVFASYLKIQITLINFTQAFFLKPQTDKQKLNIVAC